jgi:hypothetical protein
MDDIDRIRSEAKRAAQTSFVSNDALTMRAVDRLIDHLTETFPARDDLHTYALYMKHDCERVVHVLSAVIAHMDDLHLGRTP